MQISNLTVTECACKANQLSQQLTMAYNTPVYVASCEEGGNMIVCENFTCPCASRRLLQFAPETKVNIIYKQTELPKNESTVTKALQTAYSKPVLLTSTSTSTLPATVITWNPDVIFYVPVSASSSPVGAIVGALVAVVLVVGIVLMFVYCCNKGSVTAQKTINVKITDPRTTP